MTASDPALVKHFTPLQCTNRHQHLQMKGDPENLSACQIWTWEEANCVVSGISALRKKMESPSSSFPVRSTGSQARPGEEGRGDPPPPARGRDPRAPPMDESPCLDASTGEVVTILNTIGSLVNVVIHMMSRDTGHVTAASGVDLAHQNRTPFCLENAATP